MCSSFIPLAPESALVGTWQLLETGDSVDWVTFSEDRTVIGFSDSMAGYKVNFRGRWFAGGSYVYMRYEGTQHIWQIIEIFPDELRLRYATQDYTFKHVTRDPPQVSNQGATGNRRPL